MGWTLHMIMCVLLCYPVSIRIYYQQGVLFLVSLCSCSSSRLSQIYNFEAVKWQLVDLPRYLVILIYTIITIESHLHTCGMKSENFK